MRDCRVAPRLDGRLMGRLVGIADHDTQLIWHKFCSSPALTGEGFGVGNIRGALFLFRGLISNVAISIDCRYCCAKGTSTKVVEVTCTPVLPFIALNRPLVRQRISSGVPFWNDSARRSCITLLLKNTSRVKEPGRGYPER